MTTKLQTEANHLQVLLYDLTSQPSCFYEANIHHLDGCYPSEKATVSLLFPISLGTSLNSPERVH